MSTFKTVAVAFAALAAAVQVSAVEAPKNRATDLRAAKEKLAWEASKTKGTPRQLLLMERKRIEGLINELEQGRAVDPTEIDRALKRVK